MKDGELRARFEASVTAEYPNFNYENVFELDEDGDYYDLALIDMWRGWQACHAALLERQASADYLNLKDGDIVGANPDIANGRYVRIGPLPSEGGVYPDPAPPAQESAVPDVWIEGYPNHTYASEWFIAHTIYNDRVVLRALPEEYSYDFTTADGTYMQKENVKRWMQFPDSDFIAAPQPPKVQP